MLNNYYRVLNPPFVLFNKEQIEKDYTTLVTIKQNNAAGMQIVLGENTKRAFTEDAYKWIESMGCNISNGVIFYTRPGNGLGWHDDGELEDTAKFNFVWGSDNHKMQFGELKNDISIKGLQPTASGTYFKSFNENNLQNITSVKVDRPYMMNGNAPHTVTNFGSTGNWCLGMILKYNGKRLLWDDAINIFSDYLIEPDSV